MTVTKAKGRTRMDVVDILSHFLIDDTARDPRVDQSFLSKIYDRFPLGNVDARGLQSMLTTEPEVRMNELNKFLHLEPTSEKIYPLVTIQSSCEWKHFRIYALLAMLDDRRKLKSLAFRFETDEGEGTGSHNFCHAQLCIHINSHVRDISPLWFPESQPSFPLDAKDHISLVLCMLTTVYGGRRVFDILNKSGNNRVRKQLRCVNALRKLAGC